MFYFAYLENSYPELERFFCIHLSPIEVDVEYAQEGHINRSSIITVK